MNTCRICGKEIGKTYSDKKLRCSSCRKSVENAIGYNERTVEYVEDELFAWKSEYKKLKKENRKLNENIVWYEKEEDRLREKNKKLEKENFVMKDRLKFGYKGVTREEIERIEEENKKLKKYYDRDKEELMESCYGLARENDKLKADLMEDMKEITKLEQENKKLREFKEKREESMFYFKAQMERAEPKTAREAEDLQKAKELFEKLYREELHYLEEENKNLKKENEELQKYLCK